jgi:hypothetical protein
MDSAENKEGNMGDEKKIMIKDLALGAEFSGKLNEPEYYIDGDSITHSFVHMTSQTMTLAQVVAEQVRLTKEKNDLTGSVALNQLRLAEIGKRYDMLTKAGEQ